MAVSALVGVLVAAGAAWWWTHPDVLPEAYGASMIADPRPFQAGAVWTVELTAPSHFPSEGTLALRSVSVGLAERHDTTATVEVLRCTPFTTDDGGSLSVGFLDERPSSDYDCVPVVAGTRVSATDQLVAVVAPEGPGEYVIESATVSYSLDRSGLWRRGTETTRLRAEFTYA